jgi:protein-serine/threonine kinase
MPQQEFDFIPERSPEKYGGGTIQNNQKRCSQMAGDYFKDSVKRARERNLR